MDRYYRTYVTVDYNIIRENFLAMKNKLHDGVKCLAVIKADAYGHGAVKAMKVLHDCADFFGVATIDEAVELREAGCTKDILILGYTAISEYPLILKYDVIPVIFNYEMAEKLDQAAGEAGKTAKIHLAVDTGMSRIGFQCTKEDADVARKIFGLKNIYVEGAFSHFSKADETDKSFTAKQVENFDRFFELLGKDIPIKHIANSAGIIDFDKYRYDMCRAGISMYGYMPSDEVSKEKIEIKPALTWHAHVTHVKKLEPGRIISYGGTFEVQKEMTVATVSIGYADGYPRLLSNKGKVIIHDHYAPVLGRVCMDQIMVDVSDIPSVKQEDDVILLGSSENCRMDADDIANLTGTISYEVICDIGKRVPRVDISEK